jgi:hypothetical protein
MNNSEKKPQSCQTDVRRSLFELSVDEKYKYLREKVYENIKHSSTGKLLINTSYCRKVAELLGGDYDSLNKVQKDIFKGDIVFEYINVEGGFSRYTSW